jgi:hypothetical protein
MTPKEVNLPLEVVILLMGSLALLITGILLFPVSAGILPYYENGLYGLLLIIFALQIITLGKTPWGDLRRSPGLLIAGFTIATLGLCTSFVPLANPLPRILLLLCFGPGGLLLLLQLYLSPSKAPAWSKHGGIFHQLTFACTGVYVLSMLMALLVWKQSLEATSTMAMILLFFGLTVLYLAVVLQKIYQQFPEAEKQPQGDVQLSTEQALLMLVALFMLLLGLLLIPVSLGLIPFAPNAQLGLLMVTFALQMLTLGNTPLGSFPRSWPMLGAGFLFAALGIISCIIPQILVALLTFLVAMVNILGGSITLGKVLLSSTKKPQDMPSQVLPILSKLFGTQVTMNVLAIMFGLSMLMPGLVHAMFIGVILTANGGVLIYLLRILIIIDKIQA